MFEKAEWIWSNQANGTDTYAEFITSYEFDNKDSVILRISVDSNYAFYLNGVYVESGQYADYPHYKIYDEIDISAYIRPGVNHLAFVVWYYGVPSFTYKVGRPGLLFEVEKNGTVVGYSNKKVESRKSRRYISGRNELITGQLGLNYHVDLTQTEAWMTGKDQADFEASVIQSEMPGKLYPREIKRLLVKPRVPTELVQQGTFCYPEKEMVYGEKMQHAALSFYRVMEMGKKEEEVVWLEKAGQDGIYFIVDLQAENSGYLDFDLEVSESCQMEVGWGEHLKDGRCRTEIATRNFSVTAKLHVGHNCYMNPFRRLGCRYLQFFVHTSRVKIYYAGLRPAVYPVSLQEYKGRNILRKRIYEVSQNTLIQCMHEHYEDCPWREQSFYTLDSRNQMLCGYYAFAEYQFPRAALRLISKSIRDNGTLPICYPSAAALSIPAFTLFYIIQLAEYYRYSKDVKTIEDCFDAVQKIVDTFIDRIDQTGLIPNFDTKEEFWNFYEWQPYLDGSTYDGESHDMCLNALLSWALTHYMEICEGVGVQTQPYKLIKDKLNQRMVEMFYDRRQGLFRLCDRPEINVFSVLANAWAYLCGAADELDNSTMLRIIGKNGGETIGTEVIPASLSMYTFRYDALLKADRETYKETILKEIDLTYFRMLMEDATSFWETEKGGNDFYYAGSLCHGWSAMPTYYYTLLEEV